MAVPEGQRPALLRAAGMGVHGVPVIMALLWNASVEMPTWWYVFIALAWAWATGVFLLVWRRLGPFGPDDAG